MEVLACFGSESYRGRAKRSSILKSIGHRPQRRAGDSGIFRDHSAAAWVRATAAALCLFGAGLGVAQAQVVTEFCLPGPDIDVDNPCHLSVAPWGITAGPDGNLWFTEHSFSKIGRITPAGMITEFTAGLSPDAGPYGITAGPDGNLWFTEYAGNQIGRITPAGVITEFSAGISPPGPYGPAMPIGITVGPDGNLWFTESSVDRIGRITPDGVITEFSAGITPNPYGFPASPTSITTGPDGNLWFTESSGDRIGRITPTGQITEFSVGITAGDSPWGIAAGPDGNLWFTNNGAAKIGRITPAGVVTEFSAGITPVGQGIVRAADITRGPDGDLWFTQEDVDQIGRITPAGVITEFSAGITFASGPFGIAAGPDGNLWFTEANGNRIGRITTGVGPVAPTIDAPSLAPEPITGPEVLPPPPPSSNCVPGDRKLVLITHGWLPSWGPPDITAFTQLKTSIRNQIDTNLSRDACNWDVIVWDWSSRAYTGLPVTAYASTSQEAEEAYEFLREIENSKGQYKHVHLVAHSAGAAIADYVAQRFKERGAIPTIQETLLDPYDPGGNRNTYGCHANWAESYVDMGPAIQPSVALTTDDENLTLPGALNIDVTRLRDPTWPPATLSILPDIGAMADAHAWPVTWYASTVAPASQLYGWSLSLEAGQAALPTYIAGADRDDRVCLATSLSTYTCLAITTGPAQLPTKLCGSIVFDRPIGDFLTGSLPSVTGTVVQTSTSAITLTTGSPAWLKMNVSLPEAVDTLQFDVEFSSAPGANGYLTTFVDGQLVNAREEAHMAGDATTTLSVPIGSLAAGPHWVGFRLDPTNTVQSQAQISNIAFGSTTLVPDTTPPVITPIVTGSVGNGGWYRSNVSVGWQVADTETVVGSTQGCGASSVRSDTSGVTFTCSATSLGGTNSKSITIKRDTTQPVIAVLSPLSSSLWTYKRKQAVWAIYGCVDLRSGIDQCTGTVALGARIDTSSAGTKTFTVNARDKAGNARKQTVTYRVK